jgi:hypothetical protein
MLEAPARLLRLLSLFQAQRYWSVRAALSERLELTLRTLRRDVTLADLIRPQTPLRVSHAELLVGRVFSPAIGKRCVATAEALSAIRAVKKV